MERANGFFGEVLRKYYDKMGVVAASGNGTQVNSESRKTRLQIWNRERGMCVRKVPKSKCAGRSAAICLGLVLLLGL